MQVLQAGDRKLLLLELDAPIIEGIARQLGYEPKPVEDTSRTLTVEIAAANRQVLLLLFDATDPGNLGWFSRCQFYVEGRSGTVLQTPIRIANVYSRSKHLSTTTVRIQIEKELPARFRMPGRQPLTEQAIYAIVYNLLNALLDVGVAICGPGVVRPLAGRSQRPR